MRWPDAGFLTGRKGVPCWETMQRVPPLKASLINVG